MLVPEWEWRQQDRYVNKLVGTEKEGENGT